MVQALWIEDPQSLYHFLLYRKSRHLEAWSVSKSIDEPILRLVDTAKVFVSDQLHVFTRQEHGSGRFVESPEYPEFPLVEGIINAVVHRDYAASGQWTRQACLYQNILRHQIW